MRIFGVHSKPEHNPPQAGGCSGFSASDESTQQLYLKAAAEISERTSASEQTVVRKAFELSKGRTGRRALVGCSLLAEGKPELIRALRVEKKRLKGLKNDHGANSPSDSGKEPMSKNVNA